MPAFAYTKSSASVWIGIWSTEVGAFVGQGMVGASEGVRDGTEVTGAALGVIVGATVVKVGDHEGMSELGDLEGWDVLGKSVG